MIGVDAFFNSHSARLAALATRHAVPTISAYQEFAVAGGLMSYGGSIVAASHQAGVSAGRILNGEKPADLPVMQSTKVSLTINLKTAKALGLEFPITLQAGADEVIKLGSEYAATRVHHAARRHGDGMAARCARAAAGDARDRVSEHEDAQ